MQPSELPLSTTAVGGPVPLALHPMLSFILLGSGFLVLCLFFLRQLSSTKFTRDLTSELVMASAASALLAFGVLFGLLWAGVSV